MAKYATLKAAIQQVIKTNGNEEITGALLQQSLLAMIDSLGVGFQFMGVAVPATNPGTPDQNVIYLAFDAGTYPNFGGSVLTVGQVGIFTYNGSWAYTVKTVIELVNDLTTGGTNKALAAQQGVVLAGQISQLGQEVIYDVSLNNSGATFASLSALLSDANLSTLIPTSKRASGMSLRFVKTSDNKYVQFRYVLGYENTTDGNNAFKNADNWRGVDDEPAAGSENLIKSGGVAAAPFIKDISVDYVPEYHSYITTAGKYNVANVYKSLVIPIKEGDKVRIVKNTSNDSFVSVLKSLDNILINNGSPDFSSEHSSRIYLHGGNTELLFTAASDEKYLFCTLYTGADTAPSLFTINGIDMNISPKDYTNELKSETEYDLLINAGCVNVLDKFNYWLRNTNDWLVSEPYRSIFIPVKDGDSIQVENTRGTTSAVALIKSYDSIYTSSRAVDYATGCSKVSVTSLTIFTAPADAKYLWVGLYNGTDTTPTRLIVNGADILHPLGIQVKNEGITTLADLKFAISTGVAEITLGAATITLDAPLVIPSGTKIRGTRGKSIINVPASVLKGFELKDVQDVTIEGITLVGAYNGTPIKTGNTQHVRPGIVDSPAEARELNNIGYQTDLTNGGVTDVSVPQIGININTCEKVEIIGCEIKNFSYHGICNAKSGKNYRYACKFERNYINNCYCGIYLYEEAERSQYIANNVSLCQIGLYLDSGTNMFTDCAFTDNRVGLFMNNGVNHCHGIHTGCAYTHCSLLSIYAYQVEFGEIFNQCKIGYVDSEEGNMNGKCMILYKSQGITFMNGQLINAHIYADSFFDKRFASYMEDSVPNMFGNTKYIVTYNTEKRYNGGCNKFADCCEINTVLDVFSKSEDIDNTNLLLKGNYYISGYSSSELNN